jgi:hypothetical protein
MSSNYYIYCLLIVSLLIPSYLYAQTEKEDKMSLSPSEQLAYSTIRIEVTYSDGMTGTGTGFIFRFIDDGVNHIPAIVTNNHVIKGALSGRFHLTLNDGNNNPKVGSYIPIEFDNFESRWFSHPDSNVDLAVMPIAPVLKEADKKGLELYYIALDASLIPTQDEMSQLTAVEDILMVGYPIGIWDYKNNMPIFRRGITATHPAIQYNGKDEFMIDAACFPGSSGSPIMLFNTGNYVNKSGGTVIGSRIKLLGILYAGPQYTADGEIVIEDVPTQNMHIAKIKVPINLGIAIRSDKLMDFDKILMKLIKRKNHNL